MSNTLDVRQRAMFRAAMDEIEERTRSRMDDLVGKMQIDTSPIGEAIKDALFALKYQPINKIDVTPITEAISSALSLVGNQPLPQVVVDMAPVSAALSDGMQSVVSMVAEQNKKVAVLSEALEKLLKVLANQKPIQVQPQITAESPSIVALVNEQREFFARMIEVLDKPKRQIRIAHGETESVITEV